MEDLIVTKEDLMQFFATQIKDSIKMHEVIGTFEENKEVNFLIYMNAEFSYEIKVKKIKNKIKGLEGSEIIIDEYKDKYNE